MKKALSIALFTCLFSSSCKKNYTCNCTVTVSGNMTSTSNITINDTKSEAEETCKALNSSSITSVGITTSSSCDIK